MEAHLQAQSRAVTVPRPAASGAANGAQRPIRLLDQVRWQIRQLHYSGRTEDAYVYWCRAFIRFHGLRHPAEMGRPEVEAFLGWLASERRVATSTHRQALSALLFLYAKVLRIDLPRLGEIGRPRAQRRLPVVLSRDEVTAVLRLLEGEHRLFAQLLYGTGMRMAEAQQLRVKDIDFAHGAVVVRCGKGGKDRVLMLPQSLVPVLRGQLAKARVLWSADQAAGTAGVYMPDALDRKFPPRRRVLGLVLGVPAGSPFDGPAQRGGAPPPSVRPDFSAGLQARRAGRRRHQAGHAAYVAPCLCHASAAGRL
jgi:integrase